MVIFHVLFYIYLFFMYFSIEHIIFMSCTLRPLRHVILYCNAGWCVKGSAVHRSRQQSLVVEQLGLSVIVRVKVKECDFFCSLFFFLC